MMKRVLKGGLVLGALYGAYLIGYFFGEPAIEKKNESVTVRPTAATVVDLPLRRRVEEPKKEIKALAPTSEFAQLTNTSFIRLPRMEKIRKSGKRDFHHAPPELLEISDDLGKIHDAMEREAKLIPAGREFFKKCALDNTVMSAARAVCLRDLKYWTGNAPLDMSEFPEHIKKIAGSLPETP